MATTGFRTDDIINMVNRVRHAGVFCQRNITEINYAIVIENDIFKQSIAADGLIDIRFFFRVEINRLGVTTAFKIKHALIIPAMFIITDQHPVRVSRKRCLACARKAKEQRHITILPHIGGTMHGGDAFLWQKIIHQPKHAFFHLTAIP